MPGSGPRLTSLMVQGGPLHGKRVAVTGGDEVLVGSDPDCGLHLDLPGVSPVHARILIIGTQATLRDTHSPRGVYVGATRVEGEASLRPGDVVWLGPPQDEASVPIHCDFEEAASEGELIVAEVAEVEPLVEAEPVVEAKPVLLEEAPAPPVPAPVAPVAVAPAPVAPAPAEEDFFVEEGAEAPPPPAAAPAFEEFLAEEPPAPPAPAAPAEERASFVGGSATPPPAAAPAPDESVFFFEEAGLPPSVPAAAPEPTDILPSAEEVASFVEAEPVEAEPAPPTVPPPPFAPPSPPAPAPVPQPPPITAAPDPDVYVAEVVETAAPPPLPPRRPEPPMARAEAPPPRRPAAPAPAVRPAAAPRRVARPRAKAAAPLFRHLGLGAVALALVGGGAFFAMRLLGGPRLESVNPTRARMGQTVVLTGRGLAPGPEVLFGDRPGAVLKSSETSLEVSVPDVPGPPQQDMRLPVRVRAGGRASKPIEVTVYRGPTIHGISPDVGMPGEEVVLQGTGWGVGATVKFGGVPAEVLVASDDTIRVRVPPIDSPPGASAPVVVSMGGADSNAGPFLLGQIPLVISVEPRSASPGDIVSVTGRGFRRERAQNDVRIGGVRALVAAATGSELKVVVPRLPAGEGSRPLEVRVAGSNGVGQAGLAVAPPPEAVDFRFVAEPFEGRDHALLATALGPAFVLASSGGRQAAERAVEAARRLNEAAGPLKASRSQDLEMRDIESRPVLVLSGRGGTLLEVTDEDAAAYDEDWTRLRGRGGAVTKHRLARWWEAVAKDLVLMLVRGEAPRHAAGLAAEGRVLVEVFQAAQKTGRFGVLSTVVAEMTGATRDALRTLALRVPAAVKSPAGAPEAPGVAAGPATLKLEGNWTGSELEGPNRRWLIVKFRPSGGTISYEGTVTLTVPIIALEEPQRGTVRFNVQYRGGIRYYIGKWDGAALTGTVATDPASAQPTGTFEIRPR